MKLWISQEHWDTNLGQHLHLLTNADWAPRRCSCLEGVRLVSTANCENRP